MSTSDMAVKYGNDGKTELNRRLYTLEPGTWHNQFQSCQI